MILGDPALAAAQPQQGQSRLTIDEIFRRLAQRRSEALALADAPNRQTFTGGPPRRLTFAEADRAVAAIAGRLRRMGLSTDAIVGIQLPNTVENVLAILGVLRAGMIAAPLPLLWRRADAIAALGRVSAKALITCGRIGAFKHAEAAMRTASEVFSIRYVCGFGAGLPDGVVPFDDLFTAEKLDPIPPLERERQGNAAAHIALITFDVGQNGIVPVARNHLEVLAGGLGVVLEARLARDTAILSTIIPSSFAGICLTLLPWLLSGGPLLLHHPFDAAVLDGQRRQTPCPTLVAPGPVAFRLADTGNLARDGLTTVIAAWRAPERLAVSPPWREHHGTLVDVPIFGEAGLIAARRGTTGRPAPIPFGPVFAPRGSTGAVMVAELARTETGTVALRGPMVPHHTFPPGVERSSIPYFKIGRGGLVDTGYTCRVDTISKAALVTGPPSGIVGVGGYRFPLGVLQDVIGGIDGGASLTALPDPLIGQRLIGNSARREAMQSALDALGVNPIVAAAFRDRAERDGAPGGAGD